ncbi:hypothetical protein RvY_00286 [Ramazzottius varieornatus]|uniref:Cysteine/serine-rich nuclear protein N-terminal domain-containing protein n=1 Tax=Ramazzottius varieornatus TaxID=947166 RepID=A0A1D1UFY4_RAMVA|nr:hypothetical protein RvY_00286 [Ramazzottius varieornatus]
MPKRKLQDALQCEEASQETTQCSPSVLTSQSGRAEEAERSETAETSLTTPEKSREMLLKPTDESGADNPSTSNACATTEALSGHPLNEPKRKKSVRWSDVTVYLFPRQQGFTCVPSAGGVTLGMKREHSEMRNVTLTQHEQECRSRRMQYIQQQQQQQQQIVLEEEHSDEDVDEGEEDEEVSGEEEGEDEGESEEELEEEYEEGISFPVSISIRQRRSLLREAGCQVDNSERQDCQFIRVSREACGCQCQTVCNPDECSCSINKIKCQVDRYSYPCGCTKEGCGNESGRVEFNPARVKTHYLNTVSRMASSSSTTTSSECSITTERVTNQGMAATTNGHFMQQSYSQPALNYDTQDGTRHYGSDTYGQLPSTQCEYSVERSSVTTSGSYHLQSTNMSMSIESFSTTRTMSQPNYHYYNLHQPSYSEHDLSSVPEIATNGPVEGCMPYGYQCGYPEAAYSQHMISPPHEYSQHNGDFACPAAALPYPQLAADGHYSDSSPSSEASSRDSSVSDRTHDVEDLDFGELIKQSLVETALA